MSAEEEVLAVLNHVYWKTGLEVHTELRPRGLPTLGTLFQGTVPVHITLETLELKGFVEKRVRVGASSEELKFYRGQVFEYRLTTAGIKRKVVNHSQQTAPTLGGQPQEA